MQPMSFGPYQAPSSNSRGREAWANWSTICQHDFAVCTALILTLQTKYMMWSPSGFPAIGDGYIGHDNS